MSNLPTPQQRGTAQQQSHGTSPGRTYYHDDPTRANIIGSSGEIAFAARYRLALPPINANGRGDGGRDIVTPIGIVQVKTARFPKELWIKPDEINNPRKPLAPWIVLAKFDERTETATLVGWTTDTIMKLRPVKDGPTPGCPPIHFLPRDLLTPMNHLAFGGLVDYAPDAYCCDLHPAYWTANSA